MDKHKTRIQLDLSDPMVELLDGLVRDTEAATRAEVLRRAVSVFALLISEKKAGRSLEIVGKNGKRRQIVLA